MKDTRDDLEHPMQPIGFDGHANEHSPQGQPRFKANKIVKFLLDSGPFDLNMLCSMPWSKEDYTHLMQLIGYSVDGYGELSTSPDELVAKADEIAAKLREETA